jgi:hypothetical protein
MHAIAGTGSIKNVNGTKRAVAIVAVRPGIEPTNNPNSAARNMTPRTDGSSTSANA